MEALNLSCSPCPDYQPLPGHLGNLTTAQKEVLADIRRQARDENWWYEAEMDDATLLRFLRAQKFDIAKAMDMLRNHEHWRKEFGADNLVKNFKFAEANALGGYIRQFHHKTDIDGRPVFIIQVVNLDMSALFQLTTEERLVQNLVYELEKNLNVRFPACTAASGHPVETSCVILDLRGASLKQFYRIKDYLLAACSTGQEHYPETMHKIFIINAPQPFSAVWNTIKGWLDEETVRKVYEVPEQDNPDVLLQQIPKANLPKDLGGSCECKGGCYLSGAGPWE